MKANFLDEYVKYASQITDAPIDFHRFVGYVVVSSVINTNIYFPFGRKRIYPNLWIILLAPSGLARKSTSSDIGKEILTRYKRTSVFPNEFSQEKILEVLGQNPQGTFFFSEFLSFMGLLQRDYMAGTKAFFTEMFDCPYEYHRQTIKQNIVIQNPFINILSCTTIDWFLDTVKEGDISGGFLARFIMVPGGAKTRSIDIPAYMDDEETMRIVTLLYEFSDRQGVIQFEAKAREAYRQWYAKFEAAFAGADKRIQSFMIRLPIALIKFAMLESVCSGEKEISLKSFDRARQIVSWIFTQLKVISEDFVFSKSGKAALRVHRFIKDAGDAGIQRHWLIKYSHLSLRDFNEAIETLKAQQQITERKVKVDGSFKSSQVFFPINTNGTKLS